MGTLISSCQADSLLPIASSKVAVNHDAAPLSLKPGEKFTRGASPLLSCSERRPKTDLSGLLVQMCCRASNCGKLMVLSSPPDSRLDSCLGIGAGDGEISGRAG